MDVNLFDFVLPEENIALRPLQKREDAKLLYIKKDGTLEDCQVFDLPSLLRPGDVLVFNDTKVIPVRLQGIRHRENSVVNIQATLHSRKSSSAWYAFVRPQRRLAIGDVVTFSRNGVVLTATVIEKTAEKGVLFCFDREGPALDEAIRTIGFMPLPPYVASRRKEDASDLKDYQTIFAREEGAVAAPTAGLHYTQDLLKALKEKGIEIAFVTLHVGAGTFLPVKVLDTKEHKMHSETGYLSAETAKKLNEAKAQGRRVIAVGTTALRVLETAAKVQGQVSAWQGDTNIFITPGYQFRFVDCLLTNFHLPRSTLFMLVSAFCGLERMKTAYAHAIAQGYRFYSYGDTSFLER